MVKHYESGSPLRNHKPPRRSLLSFIAILGLLAGCKNNPAETEKTISSKQRNDSILVESRESLYNNIYVYSMGTYFSMTFGHNQRLYEESRYNTADDRELPEPYTQFLTVSLIYPNKIDSILEIGTGGGRTAWYLHRFLPNVRITTVELDPAVVDLSHKYFGIKDEPNFRVIVRDGRMFLTDSKDRYDVILIDAYRGPFVPFHLLTKEFYQIVKSRLAPGGVIAQNIDPTTILFDSAVKTVYAVFPQTELYDVPRVARGGSIVAIAYDGKSFSSSDLSLMAYKRQSAYELRYDLRQMLPHRSLLQMAGASLDAVNQNGISMRIDDNAKILTDDFAPVESLKAIARHNQKWGFLGEPATH